MHQCSTRQARALASSAGGCFAARQPRRPHISEAVQQGCGAEDHGSCLAVELQHLDGCGDAAAGWWVGRQTVDRHNSKQLPQVRCLRQPVQYKSPSHQGPQESLTALMATPLPT
jgi:hypothetical protein